MPYNFKPWMNSVLTATVPAILAIWATSFFEVFPKYFSSYSIGAFIWATIALIVGYLIGWIIHRRKKSKMFSMSHSNPGNKMNRQGIEKIGKIYFSVFENYISNGIVKYSYYTSSNRVKLSPLYLELNYFRNEKSVNMKISIDRKIENSDVNSDVTIQFENEDEEIFVRKNEYNVNKNSGMITVESASEETIDLLEKGASSKNSAIKFGGIGFDFELCNVTRQEIKELCFLYKNKNLIEEKK